MLARRPAGLPARGAERSIATRQGSGELSPARRRVDATLAGADRRGQQSGSGALVRNPWPWLHPEPDPARYCAGVSKTDEGVARRMDFHFGDAGGRSGLCAFCGAAGRTGLCGAAAGQPVRLCPEILCCITRRNCPIQVRRSTPRRCWKWCCRCWKPAAGGRFCCSPATAPCTKRRQD